MTVDRTPSLQTLADVEGTPGDGVAVQMESCLKCHKGDDPCGPLIMDIVGDSTTEECSDWVFGVRWTPELFVQQAVYAGHPFSNFSGLQTEVRVACECIAEQTQFDIINNRCSKLGEWLKLSKVLQKEEDDLKSRMPLERRNILKSKRILLMKHIIDKEGYDDTELAADLERGFSLVGEVPTSNVLPKKLLVASISTDDLTENSQKANTALRYMTRGSGDDELDSKLWDKTMLEVDKGWMMGPLPWSTLTPSSTVSRRFPLEQAGKAGKVRPIDDLSQSQINATVTSYEQATVDGPDVICALAVYLMKCLGGVAKSTALVGRSLDLASAYRQLAIADDSRRFAFLSVYDPVQREARLFQQVAFPFGSRTAVNAFIRCARFLQWVAAKCLRIPVSCYFDDFVSFTYKALANNTQSTLCLMLDILGWAFDKEGPKSDDFSEIVKALGVQFDLSSCGDGILRVCNTEKRVRETIQLLEETMSAGRMQKREALVLRGRLAFCDAFIFGRLGKIALQNITRHAYAVPYSAEISNSLLDSLKLLKERVITGRPRTLSSKLLQTMFLFTDASFDEKKGAGLGAVLISGNGKVVAWFGLMVGLKDIGLFLEPGRQTAIGCMTSEDHLTTELESQTFVSLLDAGSSGACDASTANDNLDFESGALGSAGLDPFLVKTPSEDLQSWQRVGYEAQSGSQSVHVSGLDESVSDVALSKSDYNRALFEARLATVGESGFKMPWETGVMGQIFGDADDSIFPSVVPPVPAEYFSVAFPDSTASDGGDELGEIVSAKQCVQSELTMPFYSLAVRVLPDRDLHAELDALWHSALQKWYQVFEILCFPGPVGNALFREQLSLEVGQDSVVLRDSLGIKSPRTAIKRAQTLLRFMSWMQSEFNDCLQWNRVRVLAYLGGGTSCASKGSFNPFGSFQICKVCHADANSRGDVGRPANPWWSDLKHVHQFWIEREWYNGQLFGFVEARTQVHKTATTLVKKKLFMPLVAPLLGVTSVDWSKHWMRAFDELGVDTTVEPFGAVCRAPNHSGGLCKRSITSQEIGTFLNGFLATSKESQISSHSLKHTSLSWCSSYGIDEPSRTLLGHHELQGSKALTVYSRDMLARPLQLYCAMLANIRCDHFRPDESRTSRMVDLMKIASAETGAGNAAQVTEAAQVAPSKPAESGGGAGDYTPTSPLEQGEQPVGSQVPSDDNSSDIPSTDSSSNDDSSDSDDPPPPKPDIEGPVWRNRRSSVVHRCAQVDNQTSCGRLVDHAHFELLEGGCSSLLARCSRCFRGEVVTNLEGLVEAFDGARAKRFKKL
eukprot:s4854_g6.t1